MGTGGDGGWPVRRQLIAIVAGVVVVFAIIAAVIGSSTLAEATERAEDDASFQAGLAAAAVSDAITQAQGAMTGLAAGLDVPALLRDPKACRLSSGAGGVFPSAHIDLVLPDGRVPCSSLTTRGAPAGATHAGAGWLTSAATRTGPAVTPPFDDRLTGGRAIAVTAPVISPDGRLLAIAAVVGPLDGMSRGLAATYGGPQRYEFTVTDPSGAELLSGRTIGPGRIIGWRAVPGLGWQVHASIPSATALGPTRSVLIQEAALALAALAVMGLLVVLVNRRVARPLRALTAAADRAARREDAQLPPSDTGPSELRRLTRSFAAMVAARDGYEAELSAAYTSLKRRTTALERSNADLELFVSSTSHDLAEPLRTITSWAQMLQRETAGRLGRDAEQAVGFIVEGAERMHALVGGILSHSKAARGELEWADVDLNEVVRETLRALEASIQASGATVEAGDLPVVEGDRLQLGQLVQNLVSNSLKFTRPGVTPEIRISAEHEPDGWRISVADNGIGVEPAHRDRIFGMFQRLNDRTDYPGTGVGLAVCERIAQRHGGRIWAGDGPDGGAAFHVLLPPPGIRHTRPAPAAAEAPAEPVAPEVPTRG
jgi:signal transduction histidine kinase